MNNTTKGRIKRDGYWYVKNHEHPMSGKQAYIAEHRLVMEEHIGRYLKFEETVHHINGNKEDNRIENLELYTTRGQHTLHHPEVLHKLRTQNIGYRRSPKTEFKKGNVTWNKGKILSLPRQCLVDGCERSAHYKDNGRKGYCSMHRQRIAKGRLVGI